MPLPLLNILLEAPTEAIAGMTLRPLLLALLLGVPVPVLAAGALEAGDAHWAAGRVAEAEASYRQALAERPDAVEPRMRLAGLHLSRQDYATAIPLFQQAISLDGTNDRAFIGLAIAYLHQGKTLMAEAALEEALRIDPSRRAALEPLLASIRQRQGAVPHGPAPPRAHP